MQSMGANDVYIMVTEKTQEEEKSSIDGVKYGTVNNTSNITEDDYLTNEIIKEMCSKFSDEIHAVNLQYTIGNSQIEKSNNTANVNIYGVSAGYFITNELTLLSGRMFSESEFDEGKSTAIVSNKLVNNLFGGDVKSAIGSEIEVCVNNQIGNFTIVGVYEYQENYIMGMNMESGNNITTDLYMPLKAASNFVHGDISYPYVQIITKVGVDSEELSSKLKNFCEPYYKSNRNCEITSFTMEAMVVSMLTDMLSTITLAISIVAGIALVVGGIGVMNIMLVSVTERTR